MASCHMIRSFVWSLLCTFCLSLTPWFDSSLSCGKQTPVLLTFETKKLSAHIKKIVLVLVYDWHYMYSVYTYKSDNLVLIISGGKLKNWPFWLVEKLGLSQFTVSDSEYKFSSFVTKLATFAILTDKKCRQVMNEILLSLKDITSSLAY